MTLKFYDESERKIVTVNAGKYDHYSLVRDDTGDITKHDLITDRPARFRISTDLSQEKTNEKEVSDISSYIYDNNLNPGRFYTISNGKILLKEMEISTEMEDALTEIIDQGIGFGMPDKHSYHKQMIETARILSEPIPDISRLAFDIEIEPAGDGGIDVNHASKKITAVSFSSNDGLAACLVLGDENDTRKISLKSTDLTVRIFDSESAMLKESFTIMKGFPCWLTFFGRRFDLPYMYNRANQLGLSVHRDMMTMRLKGGQTMAAPIKSIHLDLHDIFSNPALYTYAFSEKYGSYSLDDVATAMLGEGKTSSGSEVGTMSMMELAKYCYQDSKLTMNLTKYANNAVMNMMVILSRISVMGIDDVSQTRVSTWICSMLWNNHRKTNAIIPRRDELDSKTTSHLRMSESSIISGKKYRGGMVLEPKMGVHWGMTVLDFASMYPHLMQIHNLSYETVMCPHEECKSNSIPSTEYHTCTKRNGMLAEMIGTLRELRVHVFKRFSQNREVPKEQRELYKIIAGAIKVFMNASYGVMGSDLFSIYYLPVAESVTASGRKIIADTMERCKDMGVEVLYGDTDSLFAAGITKSQREKIISETAKIHGTELEVDKEYRFAILTELKKNYLGIMEDGSSEIKGLTGKKSHTPKFIRKSFRDVVKILSDVKSEEEMGPAIRQIISHIQRDIERINTHDISLEDLTFRMKITKPISEYTKSQPQHVTAAKILGEKCGVEVQQGSVIQYIKTATAPYVTPMELANIDSISTKKYTESLSSVMGQILPALGTSMEVIITGSKQDSIESFT